MLRYQQLARRIIFACTMGPLALGGTALLWLVSVPLIAIGVVRWMFSRVSVKLGVVKRLGHPENKIHIPIS